MTRQALNGYRAVGGALAFLVAAVLLALAVGTGSARAAGGTYRVTAGGDLNWFPDSGNIDQTSSDPLGATGTLLSNDGAVGNADYELQAGPGIVRTKLGGTFAVPSGLAYSFDPTTNAVSSTELTVSGPPGGITTSVNIHVDGVIGIPACGTSDPCGALDVEIHAGLGGIGSEFNTFGDTRKNELGLALDAIPGGYRVHGDVSSSPFGMPTNTPVPITLTIALGGGLNGRPAPSTFGGTFNDPEALYQVSFAPTGPVLNNVPAGYTVSGQNVVDNHWTDPFAPPSGDVVVTDCSDPALASLTSVSGNLVFKNIPGCPQISFPNLATVHGDVIIEGNTGLDHVAFTGPVVVDGSVRIVNNSGTNTNIDVHGISTSGDLDVSGNDGTTAIDVGNGQIGGDLELDIGG